MTNRIIVLSKDRQKDRYYTSVTKMCNLNGFKYKSIAEKKGYPKQYKGWTIDRVYLNV